MARRDKTPQRLTAKGPDVSRRKFLSTAAVAGAATAVSPRDAARAATAPVADAAASPARAPSALRPSARMAAAETGTPKELAKATGPDGSDFMVDVIKTLDIDYVCSNPASSFRALHESLIDYGGNRKPEFITCTHEETSVAMGHGYFKATGKPLMMLCHGTVGLQHATMAIYNAWCDRVPVICIGGNDLDAAYRAPGVPTYHSAQDINAIVRDYTKWDDQPVSLQHFAQSFVRAYKIAMTPPHEPVMISLDLGLQQEPVRAHERETLYIPKYVPTAPPQADAGAVREAARLLANAERPVIVADRCARTANGMRLLVELAEALQAPVIDQRARMNMPNSHYLSQSERTAALISNADVIIGLELGDYWATVNAFIDNGHDGLGVNETRIKPGTKLIGISSLGLVTKANYQDFQRFQSLDVDMAGDAEATLPALIEAVKAAIPNDRRAALEKRGEALRKAKADSHERTKAAAAAAWDASPISTARLSMEIYAQIKDLDYSLVSSGNVSGWPNRLWRMDKHHNWLGGSGGAGQGYSAPAAIGAALGNRDIGGRFSVSIQADGDLMYTPGALWTAARHKIPILSVMHNNRGYHQEVMHVQRLANRRNRVASLGRDLGPIGTSIQNPDIDYATLAKSMGYWSAGPIKDPAELGPTLKRAVEVVKSGQPALVDVWTQPR
ncbi:MAG TPA: thiamine pyrophosphate-dependent enzyme [Xanthobacteraceae bacterium]|nr:thiamine pyrophosphate-dependent enzyme [Xanthobacteraceae bacterium]